MREFGFKGNLFEGAGERDRELKPKKRLRARDDDARLGQHLLDLGRKGRAPCRRAFPAWACSP